jgi:acetyltransferase-like isoleucine patch superfamily enzyme
MFRALLSLLSNFLPWPLRRWVLAKFLGYQIHPTARLGLCLLRCRSLIMEEHTRIGHLTVCIHLDLVHLKPHATIGRGNWITGYPSGGSGGFFAHQPARRAELVVGEHSAITHRHIIDCTARVTIGSFTTFAGFRSQILSHTVDIAENRQTSEPVTIGDYCFVGTDCVILGGSTLPDFSVLGAKSLLNRIHEQTHTLYGGIPAKAIKPLEKDCKYFTRQTGYVG